jgi:hypothetical protein
MTAPQPAGPVVITREGLDRLVESLIAAGYQVVGPTVRDSAIVLGELDSADALPAGWGVDTGPGFYRLHRRDDAAVFAHTAGPGSWKQFLHPPRRQLWSIDSGGGYRSAQAPAPRYAFLGVRGCDLAAIGILGRVLGQGAHPDGAFARTRQALFVAGRATGARVDGQLPRAGHPGRARPGPRAGPVSAPGGAFRSGSG